MSYKVVSTVFSEVFIFEPVEQQGENGVVNFDLRAFHAATKTDFQFVQDNHSRSSQGVLRGLHYQIQHPQGKLVQAIQGAVFDVTVDLRRSSPNFGKWLTTVRSKSQQNQLVSVGGWLGFVVIGLQGA